MLTRWIRHNRRYLLAAVVVMLMVSWGALGALQRCALQGADRIGTIAGKSISRVDARRAAIHLTICDRLGLLAYHPQLRNFVYQQGRSVTSDAAWRYLVLLTEGEKAGIQVTNEEVDFFLRMVLGRGQRFDKRIYKAFLARIGTSDAEVRRALIELLKISKLLALRREAVKVTDAELWTEYAYRTEQAKVRFVAVAPALFLPHVSATDDELKAFYDKHKDILPNGETESIGYKAPPRVRLEYGLASFEEMRKKVEVTEKEIADYYGQHKSEYLVPEESQQEKKASEEGAGSEGGNAGADDEKTKANVPAEPKGGPSKGGEKNNPESAQHPREQTDEEPAPQKEEAEKKPGLRYRPLAEVRGKIREVILDRKSREEARKAVQNVLDELHEVFDDYVNEPLPLAQMARRHGLQYVAPATKEGRRLLSREEIQELVPAGGDVASFAFDEKLPLYLPHRFKSRTGELLCQIVEFREPKVQPFALVKDRVREDCLGLKAFDKARAAGEQLIKAAVAVLLEGAVVKMNLKLEKELGRKQPPTPENREPEAEGEAAKESEGQQRYLKIEESGFFSRSRDFIPTMGGSRPEVVEKALGLKEGQLALVVAGPKPVCYVIENAGRKEADPAGFYGAKRFLAARVLQSKRVRAVQAWMEQIEKASKPVREENTNEREDI